MGNVEPIQNPVRLGFNPTTSEDETIRKIFQSRAARTIWLGVKSTMITSQHFTEECLWIGEVIEQHPPKDADELRQIIRCSRCMDPALESLTYLHLERTQQLFDFLAGTEELRYTVSETAVGG